MSTQPLPPPLIFLSHSTDDSAAARDLARQLERAGFSVWLDLERLAPGEDWLAAIESALQQAPIFAVYVGRTGVRRWVDREVKAALIRSVDDPQFRILPILGPGAQPAELSLILRQFQYLDLRQGAPGPAELGQRLAPLVGASAPVTFVLPPDHPPYKGLETFEPEDGFLFFGRDREVEELLERVRSERFIGVIGDSGSGKSSLVRAGLLPALRHIRQSGPTGTSWRAAILRPGDNPVRELANALLDLVPGADPADRVRLRDQCADILARGSDGLDNCVGALVPPRSHTLLVIDQFEELFTQTRRPSLRQRFVDTLMAAVEAQGERPVSVVITMRADFYAHLWPYRQLLERTAAHQFPVQRPLGEQLREMIECPLRLTGCRLEPGLSATILNELGDEPGALPLLEHALFELWRRRHGQVLTHDAYEKLGRLRGAIQNHAEAIYLGMDPVRQEIARRVLVALTNLAEDPAKDTRRRMPKSEILSLHGDLALTAEVVQRLATGRLITTGRDDILGRERVELAHEALLLGWSRLRGWLDGGRSDELLRRRISADAAEWAAKRDATLLYRGSRLDAVRERFARQGPAPGDLEQAFIATSLEARDEEVRREQQQRQRSLRMNQRVRHLALILGLSTVAAVAASLVAFSALGEARLRSREAESRALAARSLGSLHAGATRALALAVAAAREALTPEAGDALRRATSTPRMRCSVQPVNQIAPPIGFSRDGRKALTIYDGVSVWDTTSGRRLTLLRDKNVFTADLSPDARQVVTGGSGVHLWDAETGQRLGSLSGTTATVMSVAFSASGRRVVAASDGSVDLWNRETGTALHFTGADHSTNNALTALDPAAKTVVTLDASGAPQVWDAETGRRRDDHHQATRSECPDASVPPAAAAGHDKSRGPVWRYVDRSPDGRWAVVTVGSQPGVARLWDTSTGQPVRCLVTPPSPVVSLAFSPDGAKLLTGSSDGTIRLWETASGRQLTILHSQRGIRQVFFAHAAPTFGLLDLSGSVSLWPHGEGDQPIELRSDAEPIVALALSPDGHSLLTRGFVHVARLFDVSSLPEPLALHFPAPVIPHFSTDGQRLSLGCSDGSIHVVSLPSGQEIAQVKGLRGTFPREPFTADGFLALTVDRKTDTLWLWDMLAARTIAELHFPGRLRDAFFAPGPVVVATGYAPNPKPHAPDTSPLICRWNTAGKLTTMLHRELLDSMRRDGRAITRAPGGARWVSDLATGRDVQELPESSMPTRQGRTFQSPDGEVLLTEGEGQTLWDTRSGRALATFHAHDHQQLLGADISGNRKYLLMIMIATGLDGATSAELWSLVDYKMKLRIMGSVLTGFLFGRVSPDGRQFVTFGGLGSTSAGLWDSSSGASLGTLPCPSGSDACRVSFSPDGRWILTQAGRVNTIFVHTARIGDLLRKAEALVPTSMTADERELLLAP